MADRLRLQVDVVLAAHRLVTPVQCRCGWRETDGHGEQWHEHAADVVLAALDLPAREAAAAEAWREWAAQGLATARAIVDRAASPAPTGEAGRG